MFSESLEGVERMHEFKKMQQLEVIGLDGLEVRVYTQVVRLVRGIEAVFEVNTERTIYIVVRCSTT